MRRSAAISGNAKSVSAKNLLAIAYHREHFAARARRDGAANPVYLHQQNVARGLRGVKNRHVPVARRFTGVAAGRRSGLREHICAQRLGGTPPCAHAHALPDSGG